MSETKSKSGAQRSGSHEAPKRGAQTSVKTKKKSAPLISRRTVFILLTALAAVLVIVVSVVLKDASEANRYQNYLDDAQRDYISQDYDSALLNVRKAMSVQKSEDALMLMARCYIAQNNIDKALETLRQMDTTDAEVISLINRMESARDARENANKVTVHGQSYVLNTTSIVLDSAGLTDEDLIAVAQMYALTNLSLADNRISDISALSSLGGLTVLNLSGNSISDLRPLSSLTSLRTLYLDDNPITDLSSLYSLSSLTNLSIKGVDITESQLKELSAALPSDCYIHSETAQKDVNDITLGGVTFKSDVTELDLSNRGLSDISALENCKMLKKLNLSGNSISSLKSLMDMPELEVLNIKDNLVTDLRPLMGLKSLNTINCEGNGISSLVPLAALSSLHELYLAGNPVSDLSTVANMSSIETLGLEETNLTDALLSQLGSMKSLRLLTIYDNPELSGEAVDELKKSLPLCRVLSSDLVYSIEIGGEKVREDVTELNLSNRSITDISSLSSFTKLQRVDLSDNSISNIYILQWTRGIKELNLSNNLVTDITAISTMSELEVLDLSGNPLNSATPLLGLSNLKTLYIIDTNLNSDQISELINALPACAIYTE